MWDDTGNYKHILHIAQGRPITLCVKSHEHVTYAFEFECVEPGYYYVHSKKDSDSIIGVYSAYSCKFVALQRFGPNVDTWPKSARIFKNSLKKNNKIKWRTTE